MLQLMLHLNFLHKQKFISFIFRDKMCFYLSAFFCKGMYVIVNIADSVK